MSGEKILVTGANGFIGFAVAKELARLGRSVVGLDLNWSTEKNPAFKAVQGDLNDVHRLHRIFQVEQITGIIHCGAVSGPMLALDNPYSICLTNVMGTINLLEVARIYKVERFLYCSSGGAYGQTSRHPLPEEVALHPNDIYSATKASGEILVEAFSAQFGFDGVSLRFPWVYGPRRKTDCVIKEMIQNALAKQPTRLSWGQGVNRQFIYISDVVSAIIAAYDTKNLAQPNYNVPGKDSYVSIDHIADTVRKYIPDADISVTTGADPLDTPRGELDSSAAVRDFGYDPKYDLPLGISEYISWLAANN